jgi:hypothetical protein
MSQYAAQVEAAVARLKSSCAEGPFKALLRDLSEIIRKLTDPNSRRTAQRIELSTAHGHFSKSYTKVSIDLCSCLCA